MTPRMKFINRIFPRLALMLVGIKLVFKPISYLVEVGHSRSLTKQRPIDKAGKPIPWITYPALHFLEERLNQDVRAFEFGSGHSTAFYARHCKEITAVEHDKEWYATVKAQVGANATLLLQEEDEDGDYCRTILQQEGLFNFIIVDGQDRLNCAKQAIKKLAPDGCILVDDTSLDKYQAPFTFLKSTGMKYITFTGLRPMYIFRTETTIFYQPDNCLGI